MKTEMDYTTIKVSKENYDWLKDIADTGNKAVNCLRTGKATPKTKIKNLKTKIKEIEERVSELESLRRY